MCENIKKTGSITVRVEYHKMINDGEYKKITYCKPECSCYERCYKHPTPTLRLAGRDILCFPDEGLMLSGTDCEGCIVLDGPEVWIFEVEAWIFQKTSGERNVSM